MKKIVVLVVLFLSVGVIAGTAQDIATDSTAINYNHELEERNSERVLGIESQDSVEDKASNASISMAAQSKDEILESKTGPNGESIYVTEGGYYYLDSSGNKISIEPDQMKLRE